jgi:hypothetical protein
MLRNSINTVTVAVLAIAAALLGCNARTEDSSKRVAFVTKYAPIEFSFPAGWSQNQKENPYDLQCIAPSQRMNTGVFAYKKVDLAADSKPIDNLWTHVNDIKSKRKNFKELEAIQKYEHGDTTITSISYTGEKDSSRNCYRFSLVEFKADPSKFAVLIQVALPEEWNQSKPFLDEITKSAKPLP